MKRCIDSQTAGLSTTIKQIHKMLIAEQVGKAFNVIIEGEKE